jgi:hypothetical protein
MVFEQRYGPDVWKSGGSPVVLLIQTGGWCSLTAEAKPD